MNPGKFAKAFLPLAALALGAMTAGCDGPAIKINGSEGKPLAELDLTGKAPTELVLLGPDEIRVASGEKLAITVEGDPAVTAQLRFVLDGDTLSVLRKDGWSKSSSGTAVVNVTMPAPRELTMAGSGKIVAASLASEAKVTIAGSGEVATTAVAAESLDLTIAGSGNYRAGGTVKKLEVSVAGSGSADMEGLKADVADLTIAGSGSARFASDGEVKAEIMGSGDVTVRGRARCTVSSMGSGKLTCESPVQSAGPPNPAESTAAPGTNAAATDTPPAG